MSSVKVKGQTESRLVAGLQELFPDCSFSSSDLKNPTTDFVLGFYLDFLKQMGVNTESLCQVSPPMYEKFGEIFMIRKISVVLRDMFRKVLFDEIAPFSMMDILQPSPGRTAAFFTAMTNFLYFAVHKIQIVDDFINDLDARKDEWEKLVSEREALRDRLNDAANVRARISDLQGMVENRVEEVKTLNEEGNQLDQVVIKKENTIKALESEIEKVTKDLAEANREKMSVEALIVHSPLEVKNIKCQLEQKLIEVDEKTNAAKDMLTSKREALKKLETLGEDLDSRIAFVTKVIAESKDLSNDKKHIDELRRELSKLSEDIKEYHAEMQKLNIKEAQLRDSESGLQLRSTNKSSDILAKIKATKRELEEITAQKSQKKVSTQLEIGKRREKLLRFQNAYQDLSKKYEEMYAALLSKERGVGEELAQELDESISKISKD